MWHRKVKKWDISNLNSRVGLHMILNYCLIVLSFEKWSSFTFSTFYRRHLAVKNTMWCYYFLLAYWVVVYKGTAQWGQSMKNILYNCFVYRPHTSILTRDRIMYKLINDLIKFMLSPTWSAANLICRQPDLCYQRYQPDNLICRHANCISLIPWKRHWKATIFTWTIFVSHSNIRYRT